MHSHGRSMHGLSEVHVREVHHTEGCWQPGMHLEELQAVAALQGVPGAAVWGSAGAQLQSLAARQLVRGRPLWG
jgi:hypothetical protein